MSTDSPDLTQAKQLLDGLKRAGFQFRRTASGEDGPLLGQRESDTWVDLIYLEGFSHDCYACRQRRSPLLIPGQGRWTDRSPAVPWTCSVRPRPGRRPHDSARWSRSRREGPVKHTRTKKNQGLVTTIITYRDGRHPHSSPPLKLTVDVQRDDVLDGDYLAAMVAVRTGTPLNQVRITEVRDR